METCLLTPIVLYKQSSNFTQKHPSIEHSYSYPPSPTPYLLLLLILQLSMASEPSNGRSYEHQPVAVVVVPFPAQGHLNQLLHFALILSSRCGVPVHYAAPASHVRQAKSRLHGWDPNSLHSIRFHDLPIHPFPTPSPDPDAAAKFPAHLQPLWEAFDDDARVPLAALLRTLSPTSQRLVIVHEPLSSFAAEEAAGIPNAESYAFQCIPVSYILSWRDEGSPGRELLRARGVDFPSNDGCMTDEFLAFAGRRQNWIELSSGTLLNTCREIEGEFVDVLAREPKYLNKKLFTVGPLNPVAVGQGKLQRHDCLEWLDKQPPASVLYVSFGSTTTLPDAQIEQLAIALLNSNHRFIWVLRDADRGDIFAEGGKPREGRLPQGFAERVEGRGIVIRDWAPQLEILAHEATAAFVSHCGWNSCMESISMGVPVVGWPMHSDQPRNAVFVSEYLKVGVVVRDWARREETVTAAEIEDAIKKVMVDDGAEEIRRRAKALGEAVRGAVADGGSSRADFDAFIAHISG
ncbi:putative cis-zeatin O-glucosyltransferase isoform X1 [Ananas comosus]|uniref:Glycosyltransferase n=1 Tax=Ananas comosus TaxID=4615 RepID=A0A6P5ERD2_ANACO|nr:putative cis-zeatin O-glucosyltransferase isoform X1 [Ananas comosus]